MKQKPNLFSWASTTIPIVPPCDILPRQSDRPYLMSRPSLIRKFIAVTPRLLGEAQTNMFWRLCAVASIAGGVLRVIDAFPVVTGSARVQLIAYPLTDLMLLLGLCGLYFPRRKILGVSGLLGFVAAVVGLLIVRTSGVNGLGANSYLIGATITLIGVVTLSVVLLARAAFPKPAPSLWIASFFLGMLGLVSARLNLAVTVAGICFGVGFVVAGIYLLRPEIAA